MNLKTVLTTKTLKNENYLGETLQENKSTYQLINLNLFLEKELKNNTFLYLKIKEYSNNVFVLDFLTDIKYLKIANVPEQAIYQSFVVVKDERFQLFSEQVLESLNYID